MVKSLPILTILIGLALIVTPWIFRFSGDHVASIDAVIGGIVVAGLGALTYQAMSSDGARRAR